MAIQFPLDRIRQKVTVVGTGSYRMYDAAPSTAADTGYQRIYINYGDGAYVEYCVEAESGKYEIGLGKVNGQFLDRYAVRLSSNADAAVDWQAGDGILKLSGVYPAQNHTVVSNLNPVGDADFDGACHINSTTGEIFVFRGNPHLVWNGTQGTVA